MAQLASAGHVEDGGSLGSLYRPERDWQLGLESDLNWDPQVCSLWSPLHPYHVAL